ncbi:DUF3158 family protein [Pseudomonas caricapapayae]|uniref:DUF3158 family protein n=1 Tax=Pseudomonas caricapapayae TaxID=46678 RepID=UPI001CC20D4C|nr:DUF3158 family protein [Pseudomonas caricapapayae]
MEQDADSMPRFGSQQTESLKQTAFRPLESTAYSGLEHAASLKGFLKPFKGKGELDLFADRTGKLRDDLMNLAIENLLSQASQNPYSMLPVQLMRQTTDAGTVFLRWRRVDRARMGVKVWEELMASEKTPSSLLQGLYEMEIQRIAINMQISLVHTLARQASECAEKMGSAEMILQDRLASGSTA